MRFHSLTRDSFISLERAPETNFPSGSNAGDFRLDFSGSALASLRVFETALAPLVLDNTHQPKLPSPG